MKSYRRSFFRLADDRAFAPEYRLRMNDLGLDVNQILSWFGLDTNTPYQLVRVTPEHVGAWPQALAVAFRRCYITDALLNQSAASRDVLPVAIVAVKLPDPGSTMAGDFGEIIVYLYQGAQEFANGVVGATKWRLKQDRTKPTPYSDVVHLVLPTWPVPSDQDGVVCSEVKTKSTDGQSRPITDAIRDCAKDRKSRLAGTLVWLRERAMTEDLGDLQLDHLNRFINAIDYPAARTRFNAVAVICSGLVDAELAYAPAEASPDYTLIIIAVPDLRDTYTAVYEAAKQAVVATGDEDPV